MSEAVTGSWGSVRVPARWRMVRAVRRGSLSTRSLDYRAPADRAPSLPSRPKMLLPRLVAKNAFRHKLRTGADGGRHRRRDHGVRPPAHDRRRMVRGRQCELQRAPRHAQLGVARLLAAAHLRAEDPAGAGRALGVVGELVRRRLRLRAQFLPAVRDRRADAISTCIPSSCSPPAERKAFLTDRKGAVVGRKLAEQYRLEGRRHDPAARARSTRARGTSRCAASTTADKGVDQSTTLLPLGLSRTRRSRDLSAPRRPDRRVHRAASTTPARRPRCRRRSTRRSGTRSPRRSPETEKAFQLSFVAMTEAILLAIQAVSFVVIVIIMAVMANTMAMTCARARLRVRDAEGARVFRRVRRAAHLRRNRSASRSSAALPRLRSRSRSPRAFAERMGTLFPIFFVSEQTMLVAGASPRLPSASSPLRFPAWRTASGAASSMAALHGLVLLVRQKILDRTRKRSMTHPVRLHRAQHRRAPAHDGAHRRRHGARRLRVRDGADARGGARADARSSTGQDDNVVVIRRAAQTEVQSGVDRRAGGRSSRACPTSRSGGDGQKLVSKEPVVLINLPKRDSGKPSNVVIRGVTPGRPRAAAAGEARRGPDVPAGNGRGDRRALDRRTVSRARASARRCASPRATGRSSASSTRGRTGFDSEIWGDSEQMLQAFRRLAFSALVFRLADTEPLRRGEEAIESDPRLTLEAKRETRFYADQSEMLSKFISYPRHDDLASSSRSAR